MLSALPEEHKQLAAAARKSSRRRREIARTLERQRQEAIAKAKDELEAYEKEIAPQASRTRPAARRAARQADAELKEYEAPLPRSWRPGSSSKQPTAWTPLDPIELSSTNNAKLEKEADLSVLASGPNGKTTYKFVARTD